MNREEAKKKFWENGGVFSKMFMYCLKSVLKCPYKGREIDIFIDEIYDDFESRTCRNCKYFIKDKFVCCNSKAPTIVQINEDSFGCSKFERRDK